MGDVLDYLLKNSAWVILSSAVGYLFIKLKTLSIEYKDIKASAAISKETVKEVEALSKNQSALQDMVMALTRTQVLRMYETAESKGYRTDNGTAIFIQLVRAYYTSGGNGMVQQLEKDYLKIKMKTSD